MAEDVLILRDCVVLVGEQLDPYFCKRFVAEGGLITEMELGEPVTSMPGPSLIAMPGMVNGHTHVGDSFIADGATGMTLEAGFFRPNGYKYRQLAAVSYEHQYSAIRDSLSYMAKTGTVSHLDFREQGEPGAKMLRKAAEETGIESIVLGQTAELPFAGEELRANAASLSDEAIEEYRRILKVAHGVSESTINDLTDPAWQKLIELTGPEKVRAIHCLESITYREESLAISGRGDLERAIDVYDPDIIVHLTIANDEEIEILRDSGKVAVINPRANAALGLPVPPIRKLIEAEIPLLLGTDNVLLNSPNLFDELDYTYRITKSQYGNAVDPDPRVILSMATANMRYLEKVAYDGSIEVGGPATFCLLDGRSDHLVRSQHLLAGILARVTPSDVLGTWNKGSLLYSSDAFDRLNQ